MRADLPALKHVLVIGGAGDEAFEALLDEPVSDADRSRLKARRLSPDAVIELLGVARGVVALTKTDLVDDELLEMAHADVERFLADTPYAETIAACREVGEKLYGER